MAIYHMTAKVCKTSAAAKIDYINREEKYSYSTKAEDLIYKVTYNLPDWAENEKDFFSEMDRQELSKTEKEYRDNPSLNQKEITSEKRNVKCREIEFALPNELSREEQIELAEEYCKELLGNNHVYSFAIHENNGALSGEKNPHVHLVYSDRLIEKEKMVDRENFCRQRTGYKKDREITGPKRQEWYQKARTMLADKINERLELKGLTVRVSEKAYKEQGINKIPQEHLGYKTVGALAKNEKTERFKRFETKLTETIKAEHQTYVEKKVKEMKPSLLERAKAGASLFVFTYEREEDRESEKSVLKGQKDAISDFRAKEEVKVKASIENRLQAILSNSRATLERKKYYSKEKLAKIEEKQEKEWQRWLDEVNREYEKQLQKTKEDDAKQKLESIYKEYSTYEVEPNRLLGDGTKKIPLNYQVDGIKLYLGSLDEDGLFLDNKCRCYELSKVAEIKEDKLTVMGIAYTISNQEMQKEIEGFINQSKAVIAAVKPMEEKKAAKEKIGIKRSQTKGRSR